MSNPSEIARQETESAKLTFDILTRYQLVMGRNIGESGYVADGYLEGFLRGSVAPRFEAFSVAYGRGYWKGVPERNVTIEIIADESHEVETKIAEIASEYNSRFKQECVLVTRESIGVLFHSDREESL